MTMITATALTEFEKGGGRRMEKKRVSEEVVTVHCSCGWRLFDMRRDTQGTVSIKCPHCRAVVAVTMKNQDYLCSAVPKRIQAYAAKVSDNRKMR